MDIKTCSHEGCTEPATQSISLRVNQMGRFHHSIEAWFCERHFREMTEKDAASARATA